MTTRKRTTRKFVLDVLRESEIRRINFRYRSCSIYSSGFAQIARLIESGHITVGRRLGSGQGGSYYFDRDEMFISDARENRTRATVVHEATHALQDFQRRAMETMTSEGAAYVAAGFYSVLKERASGNHDWTARPSVPQPGNSLADLAGPPNPHLIETNQIAYNIARRILGEDGGYHVLDEETEAIEAEIVQVPLYASRASEWTLADGIGR